MATIGLDCEVILDGSGYFVKPGTYQLQRPRVRKATVRADGNESYIDLGPGKRAWHFVVLGNNELLRYDGAQTGTTGQQYRDALWTSYLKVNTTLSFTDPQGNTATVRFDHLQEVIADLRTQLSGIGLVYELLVELVEA